MVRLYPRSPRAPHTWLIAALVLLPLSAGLVLSRSGPRLVQVVTLVHAPDAVALDQGTGRAFVGSGGTVSIVDLAHGRVVRTVLVGAPRPLAPLALALDPITSRLFVAMQGDIGAPGVVQVLDSRSGDRLAAIRVSADAAALAVAVDTRRGHVFVATEGDGTVSMLDARSGALLRTISVGLAPVALAVDERTARAVVVSFVVSPGHEQGTARGCVSLLDTASGHLVRTVMIGDGSSAVALDGRTGRVFVANQGDGTVSVLDAYSGTLRRTIALGGTLSALAMDERRGRVYVFNAGDGTLSLLEAASGMLIRTVRVSPLPSLVYPLPAALAVDEARDRVYLSSWGPLEQVDGTGGLTLRGNGTLVVLDARTGTVLRRITVGVAPQAMAVEVASGRVVVVNRGGDVAVHPADDWLAQGAQRLRGWLPWLGRIVPRPPELTRVPSSLSIVAAGT